MLLKLKWTTQHSESPYQNQPHLQSLLWDVYHVQGGSVFSPVRIDIYVSAHPFMCVHTHVRGTGNLQGHSSVTFHLLF